MAKFMINDVELEYDGLDVETAGKAKLCKDHIANECERSAGLEMPENLNIMCDAVKKGFDILFGEGVGVKVCGERNNIGTCSNAYAALLKEDKRQEEDFEKNNHLSKLLKSTKKK